jgi:hypothetical protein
MTESTFRCTTPAAFRTALKELFGRIARNGRRYRLDELQRQFAYDRALARLFTSSEADHWVLKGAGALLARLTTARHSKNLDVNARLGPTPFASFHIDVVVGTVMTGTPDIVAPLTPLDIEGLIRPRYRVFPIADHLADKLCATIGSYPRTGQPTSSSRVKDLVDIAIIASTQTVQAAALTAAVTSNAAMRKIELPQRFTVPDAAGWATRYPRVAAEAPGPAPDFAMAVAQASQIFDPILNGTAVGRWSPSSRSWTPD